MEKYAKRFTKQEKSWILYDWANSVYATNIMAAIFPIYFGAVCESAGVDNVQVWGLRHLGSNPGGSGNGAGPRRRRGP